MIILTLTKEHHSIFFKKIKWKMLGENLSNGILLIFSLGIHVNSLYEVLKLYMTTEVNKINF